MEKPKGNSVITIDLMNPIPNLNLMLIIPITLFNLITIMSINDKSSSNPVAISNIEYRMIESILIYWCVSYSLFPISEHLAVASNKVQYL